MNYHYDKKRRRGLWKYVLGVIILCTFLFISSFPKMIFDILERPFKRALENQNDTKRTSSDFFGALYQGKKVFEENKQLKESLTERNLRILRADYLEQKLTDSEMLITQDVLPGNILSWSMGGETFIIDKGSRDGIVVGDYIVSHDLVALGYVSEVFDTLARVTLYSKNGEEIQGIIFPHNVTLSLRGQGNGSFVIEAPRDIESEEGNLFYSLSQPGYLLGIVQKVSFDPRDPFKKLYLGTPLNLKTSSTIGIIHNTLNSLE